MPQREPDNRKGLIAKPSRRITVPISREDHEALIHDADRYRVYLDALIEQFPELFPSAIEQGYVWHDVLPESKKLPGVRLRRIALKARDAAGKPPVYTLTPSYVLPSMTGFTDEVEKALFLRGFGVPFWALTYVFGRNDVYWYRLAEGLGRYDIVGTTLKDPARLPEHLLADEKHTWLNGETVYLATTVAAECVLGASLAVQADTEHLTEAYGHFKTEAQRLCPTYQPQTVNTDGWSPTQQAWQKLFPLIAIIQCFLHASLKIRDCAKRLRAFPELQRRVWAVYQAQTPDAFYRQVAELYAWARRTLTGPAWQAVQKLCAKTGDFILAFEHPGVYRTSNMIDRQMEPLARCLYSARYFHAHLMSAEFRVRAWALLHNFQPYCPRALISHAYASPAHRLNGFVYHPNWLHNLLISTSCQVVYAHHRK